MADKEAEVSQADLFGQLEKSDVTVDKKKAEEMKENILNDKGAANYLGIGVHDVTVTSVELTQAKTGTLGIKFNVENADGKNDVTMWLSEAALPYTIENVSRLMVHNAQPKNKDAARNHMSNIVSAKELFETVKQTIEERQGKGKVPFQCWLSVREARDGSTYTNSQGEEKPSLERNLLSYAPKATATQAAVQATGGEIVTDKDTLEGLPF